MRYEKVEQLANTDWALDEGAMRFGYYRDPVGGAWLLHYNYVNPDDDDTYQAFSSEAKLRRWVRREWPSIAWDEYAPGVWRGIALPGDPPEADVA